MQLEPKKSSKSSKNATAKNAKISKNASVKKNAKNANAKKAIVRQLLSARCTLTRDRASERSS